MNSAAIHVPIVIVGGGPVGLALAADLGWRGIHCLLIEKTDGEVQLPKTNGVNIRTMEFCRRWGLNAGNSCERSAEGLAAGSDLHHVHERLGACSRRGSVA